MEYESYGLLNARGIRVPAHCVVESGSLAVPFAGEVVIKAQVLAGGRGKGRFIGGLDKGVVIADREYSVH